MSPTIGVALIGAGIFAKEHHLPAIQASPLLQLNAIYSRSLSSAKEASALHSTTGPAVGLYSDDSGSGKTYHDLLLREDVSAVIIALPIVSQSEYIEAALAAGKHVLSEKPLAKDVATGKKLIAYHRKVQQEDGKQGVLFGVAENHRYKAHYAYAAEQISKLGKVTHFNVKVMGRMGPQSKYYSTAWRARPEHQGGFLLDSGVHDAAALRWMLHPEKAQAVCAFTNLVREDLSPVDTISAAVRLASGATGVFNCSMGSTIRASEMDFACEGGSVKIEGGSVTVRPLEGEPVTKTWEWEFAVREEVQAWAEGIQRGKLDGKQSAEEALADLELLEMMFRSGEEGGAQKTYELQ